MVTWPNLGVVNVWFQKIAIRTPRRVTGNSEGKARGHIRTKTGISKHPKIPCGRGMDIFWTNTLYLFERILACFGGILVLFGLALDILA